MTRLLQQEHVQNEDLSAYCDPLCEEAPLLPKLRGYFAKFLKESCLTPLVLDRDINQTLIASLKEILTRRPVAATIRLTVPAGAARPGPPVGTALGQYRLNLMAFCKDFNARTQKYKADTPMSVTVTAFKDNTFEFIVKSPSVTWYLKKAAGIELGSGRPGHVGASTVMLKHIYEIAKVKQSDPYCQYMSLESISKSIIGTAQSMGIKVVKDLE